jgi:hypothetical protein
MSDFYTFDLEPYLMRRNPPHNVTMATTLYSTVS